MSVVDKLNRMHREAVEQIRAGEDNEFLVGFLTTATMLELSNLLTNELDLEKYAAAIIDVITQYAPIDRCRVQFDLRGFPTVIAASGAMPKRALPAGMEPGESTVGILRIDGVTSGTLIAEDVPAPLLAADFIQVAADQIAASLGTVLEREHEQRRAALERVVAIIDRLDERWQGEQLDEIVEAIIELPTVCGAKIIANVERQGGQLVATTGSAGVATAEREFRIDSTLDVVLTMNFVVEPWSTQHGQLDTVANALATSLSRVEQNIRLLLEAETDQLTRLWNRRKVGRDLVMARNLATRDRGSFAVAMFDLDHFKQVNDRFGHLVGDAVLVSFADLVRRIAPSGATAARWGGEEFLLIMPGATEADAAAIVTSIVAECSAACADAFPDDDEQQTVSAGVAAFVDFPKLPNEALVKLADEALYRAKMAGRNGLAAASGRTY